MTDNSKKLSELPQATTLAKTDRVVILRDPSGSASARTITVNNFTNSLRYSSDSESGVIKVGNNLTINATGYLNAVNIASSVANNTSFVGSVSAANVVSNSQLSSNLANYQTIFGLAANVATLGYQTISGLAANVAILTANVGRILTTNNVPVNSELSVDNTNYKTNATTLSLNTRVQKLGTDDLEQAHNYYLPDGSEGQLMYITTKNCDFAEGNILIWMDNMRLPSGVLIANSYWMWNGGGWGRSLASVMFIDGAWNIDGGAWGP
jgi:hypothetical protein